MARFFTFAFLLSATLSSALVPKAELETRQDAIASRNILSCAIWCVAHFAHPGSSCIVPALHHKGPCYTCGPASSNPAQKLCSGACVDTSSDNNNCGSCGNACPASCTNGVCDPVGPTCIPFGNACDPNDDLPCCDFQGSPIPCNNGAGPYLCFVP